MPEQRAYLQFRTHFYQTEDILPTKYCQMLANSTYFSYPAPLKVGAAPRCTLQRAKALFDLREQQRRNEQNIHSVLSKKKNIFRYKMQYHRHKSFTSAF